MNITQKTLSDLRKTYLESLNQAEGDTKLLHEILVDLEKSQPGLFVSDVDETLEPLNHEKRRWDTKYFSIQKNQAERSFSRERVNHLLEVREFFRQRGDKGFVPKTQPVAHHDKQEETSDYTPSNNLKQFVVQGDLLTIRVALRSELIDRRLESHTIRKALAWVKKQKPALCEVYTEKAFSRAMDDDRSHWTLEYFCNQEVYLDTSFTEERFLHMVDVREYLRQQGVEGFAPLSAPESKTEFHPSSASTSTRALSSQGTDSDTSTHSKEPHLNYKMVLWIGGAIAALVLLILSL